MADKLTLDRNAMRDRSTAHLRIYVGGITENASVNDIYNHFIKFGQINGIVVNKNFGFVQFDQESSAQEAISKANGTMFQGKNISVRTAQTNADKARRETEQVIIKPDVPPAMVLTNNVPVEEEEADEYYDSYGNYIGDQNYRDEEYDDSFSQNNWNDKREIHGEIGRNRGMPRGRGRGDRMRGGPGRFREPSPGFGRGGGDRPERLLPSRYPQKYSDYTRPVPVTERNDCEIIVVSKALTAYAEYIENRLKHLGIVVDLLFPMEDVPIGKVLGNIASRGCLYAILVMPQNQEHRSLTLTILHGLPQEHRNMPLEDALQLLSRNFQEVQRGGPSGREAVYALLGQLADGRTLTVLQYDKVLEYLQERREQQVKIELGEPLSTPTTTDKKQVLQDRILSLLNEKKNKSESPAPVPAPTITPTPATQSKLLSDPTVRKALDSILMKFT